ncbi:hypothetical protein TWF718_000447 [Orbilia javanica]|uniref:NB-ARC domain-containing protein n=1 Tax=Orbilia javanica TaxID=47235 RepID=A0AAN8MZQ5_9PEZI
MATKKNRETFRAVNICNGTSEAEFKSELLGRLTNDERETFELRLHLAPSCTDPETQTAIFKFERIPNPHTLELRRSKRRKLETRIPKSNISNSRRSGPDVSEPRASELPFFLQNGNPSFVYRGKVIAIDADFFGLTQLYPVETSEIKIDIVALSGLNSHAYGSWVGPRVENVASMWLQDFLSKDSNLKYCRTMIFGYNTKYRDTVKLWIEDHVENLLIEINKARRTEAEKKRPLVLMGHSFGGTILSHAFVHAQLSYEDIYDSVRGIFFFSVPFRGIYLKDVFFMLHGDKEIGDEGRELVEGIAYETARVTGTIDMFKKRIEETKTRVFSFYETRMTPKVIKLPDGGYARHGDPILIVNKDSVALGISGLEELFPAKGNHSTIVKFESEQDPAYRTVHDRLNEIIQSAETVAIQGRASKNGTDDANIQQQKIKDINFVIPFHMPFPRNRNFVGRAEKLGQIYKYFSDTNSTDVPRVFALTGTGGMGKTQIALEYAYRHHRDYTAVFWVSAASEDTIRASFIDIMQRIVKEQARITWPESPPDYHAISSKLSISGLVDEKGIISPNLEAFDNIRSALFSWLQLLGNSRWLLIFDNVDDLETFSIKEYLPNQGSGTIFITSRRQEFSQSAKQVDVDGLDSESAVALLLNLAHLTDISGVPENEAIRLVEKLGFMPLAITHAGCYIYETKLPLVEYLSYYDKAFMKLQSQKPRFGWDYMNGTAATTWEISFSRVKEEDKEAAMLLLVSSYLNPEEISNDLWYNDLTNEIEIGSKILLLASYSLVKIIRFGVFSVHPVVHTWARERSDQSEHLKTIRYAIAILGRASQRGTVSRESKEWEAREERKIASHLEYLHQNLKSLIFVSFLEEQEFKSQNLFDYAHNIARVFDNQGKYDEAMQWYERALAGTKKVLGEDHPSTFDTVNNIALVFKNQGKYDEAMQWYERALAGTEKALGEDHPSTLITVNNIALVFFNQGKYDEAMQWYERSLAGKKKALGEDHPSTLSTVNNIALVFFNQGKYDEAMQWYERLLAGKKKVLGEDHPSTLIVVNNIAEVFFNQGKYDEAMQWYKRSLAGK